MGSFYFTVRDGQTLTRDPTPHLFSTIQVARDCAIQIVRELFNEHGADDSIGDRRIEICDETGHPVSFVQASDVCSTTMRSARNFPAAPREHKT